MCYVPNWVSAIKQGADYLYLAIREAMESRLTGSTDDHLSFQTLATEKERYKLNEFLI